MFATARFMASSVSNRIVRNVGREVMEPGRRFPGPRLEVAELWKMWSVPLPSLFPLFHPANSASYFPQYVNACIRRTRSLTGCLANRTLLSYRRQTVQESGHFHSTVRPPWGLPQNPSPQLHMPVSCFSCKTTNSRLVLAKLSVPSTTPSVRTAPLIGPLTSPLGAGRVPVPVARP